MVATLVLVCWAGTVRAQLEIRPEDQFWRKRVVQRLDLGEKINRPFIQPQSNYYRTSDSKYSGNNGIIQALIDGVKAGEYVAYHPDDWDQPLVYEDLFQRMQTFEKDGGGFGFEEPMGEEAATLPADPFADPFASDGSEDPFAPVETEDPFAPIDEATGEDTWETGFATEEPPVNDDMGGPVSESGGGQTPDILSYEESLHIVEDWVFDKNRSMMEQKIDYFEVIWTDPMGVLPEKVLARFLWKDVESRLDNAQWKGRFNDAENRSIAEAIKLRMFHAYPISVGGVPISSLDEAERRRMEMIEFEHHLWSY
jgi:hypothetical protein